MAASPEPMRPGTPSAESSAPAYDAVGSGSGGRILAAHAVATRFYQAQLVTEDGTTARAALGRVGVPIDGPWALGYAPDRPTAVVNELRRHGFDDAEIRATGLARTSRSGALVDRFRNRVMVGVGGSVDGEQGVIAFVGYRPPGAPLGAPAILYSPASAIHRPRSMLFGVAEQAERVGGATVIANDPLEAMIVAAQTVNDPSPPLVVAPAGPALTPTHVEELSRLTDPAAEVTVTVGPGPEGSRAAGRAYTLLTSTPERERRLLAARRYGDLRDVRALVEFVVRDRSKEALGARLPGPIGLRPGAGSSEGASELETSDDRSQGHKSFEAEESSLADDSPPVESVDIPAAPTENGGHTLPKRARPVPGVEGYHSLGALGGTTVYGPDNAPIAVGTRFDQVKVGEVDGTRIVAAGHDFDVVAARQHQISRLAPEELDRVWVEISHDSSARAGYVVVVHGIVKGDRRDDWLINGPASFLWSAKRKAHATRPTWTKAVVDRYCSTLLSELTRQGRNAIVRNGPGLEQGQVDLRLEVEVEGEGPREPQRPGTSRDEDIVNEIREVDRDYETTHGEIRRKVEHDDRFGAGVEPGRGVEVDATAHGGGSRPASFDDQGPNATARKATDDADVGRILSWSKAPGGKRYEASHQGHEFRVTKQNTATGGPRWKTYHRNPAGTETVIHKGDYQKAAVAAADAKAAELFHTSEAEPADRTRALHADATTAFSEGPDLERRMAGGWVFERSELDLGQRRMLAEDFALDGATSFLGSPAAMHALGVEPDVKASPSAMEALLDHRSAGTDSGTVVWSQGPEGRDGSDGVRGHVAFEFHAPQRICDRFMSAGPEEQARIKVDLREVADKSLARVTSVYGLDARTEAFGKARLDIATGYVAIATPDQVAFRNGRNPLSVKGLIVAIERPDGTLAAADGTRLASESAQQLANEVAAKELEARGMGQEHAVQRDLSAQRGPGVEM